MARLRGYTIGYFEAGSSTPDDLPVPLVFREIERQCCVKLAMAKESLIQFLIERWDMKTNLSGRMGIGCRCRWRMSPATQPEMNSRRKMH